MLAGTLGEAVVICSTEITPILGRGAIGRRPDESWTASMAFVGRFSPGDSLFFASWREVPAASGLAPAASAAHEREIVRFLCHCDQRQAAPTVGAIQPGQAATCNTAGPVPAPRVARFGLTP